MKIPTEEQITPVLEHILCTSNFDEVTLRMVMKMLAENFNIDAMHLAERKKFVRKFIEEYLENSYNPADDERRLANVASRKTKPEEDAIDNHSADAYGNDNDDDDDDDDNGGRRASKRAKVDEGDIGNVYLTHLEKAVILAEPLANFLGVAVLPRTHVPKRIQQYVKEKDLQDPADRRKIRCDDALKELFHCDSFTFFTLNKLLTALLYKPDEVQDEQLLALATKCNEQRLKEKRREREEKLARGEPIRKPRRKTLRPKHEKGTRASIRTERKPGERKPTGLQCKMQLSQPLAEVCGGQIMPRTEVVSRIWAYIKEHELNKKGKINCDAKLQAIFDGNKEVSNFGFNKFLSAHLTRIE